MLFKSAILKFLPLLPLAQADGLLRGARQQRQKIPVDQQDHEHSTPSAGTRQLSSEMVFTPLSCNSDLDVSACSTETTLSSILNNADTTKEVLIPCGTCALVDTTDGSTVDIPAGLNIEGMLFFPSASHVTIETTHMFVQGKLKMDPPALASSNSIRVRIWEFR